ncbi:unnamed protein product [Timema podura]|uniref:NADH dehydrogenase subunit 6 n=1 Tax=Timema podura TaxID=61482 RepID=A0ABN7NQ95_TIMPD|nr:unnamed protein product [Timema podura]
MIVTMTAMLVSAVDLSNIFSVFLVLVCFCGMVLFIMRNIMVFRLHGDDIVFGGPIRPLKPHIPQMKMMKVHIPFTFKLQETSKSSYAGGSPSWKALFRTRTLLYGSILIGLKAFQNVVPTKISVHVRESFQKACILVLPIPTPPPSSHHSPPTPLEEKVGTLLIPSTYTSVLPTVYRAVTAQTALRCSLSNKNTTEVGTSGSLASSAFHTNSQKRPKIVSKNLQTEKEINRRNKLQKKIANRKTSYLHGVSPQASYIDRAAAAVTDDSANICGHPLLHRYILEAPEIEAGTSGSIARKSDH